MIVVKRLIFTLIVGLPGLAKCVDVSFEGHESIGYFLKPSQQNSELRPHYKDGANSFNRFTLLGNTSPGTSTTVKAQYGPFSARQTIPSAGMFNILTDAIPSLEQNSSYPSKQQPNELSEQLFYASSDISAHLVVKELQRDNPVLKVLFHSTSSVSNNHGSRPRHDTCVTLVVHVADFESLNTTCSPSQDGTGTCLAEIVIPAIWWPPMDDSSPKSLKRVARVEYIVHIKKINEQCKIPDGSEQRSHIADLPLSTSHGEYEEIRNDDFVSIMVPQTPIYPRSRVYVPVFLQPNPTYPIYVVVITARVRGGLRIVGAQASQPHKWTIEVDLNEKRTVASVTVFANEATLSAPPTPSGLDSSNEVFSWLLEVDAGARYYDPGMITWGLKYKLDSSMTEQYYLDDEKVKLKSTLNIQKDDIQAVLPIAKSSELINTAVLNGRQVSRAMKVFIVSQAGEVSDVTLQSSCSSVDESILKVSSSCTSVYLDGSEIRGSQNASVFVKYGTYTGQTRFVVWMPELPLDIHVTDKKLSQIKNWKVSRNHRNRRQRSADGYKSNSLKNNSNRQVPSRRNNRRKKNKKYDAIINNMSSMRGEDIGIARDDKEKGCKLRYQQTKVEVYAEFLAVDDNSGRESYLISRKTSLKITHLVENFLRVSDSRIASLDGQVLMGHQVGRTEVQVLSPITGRVIGAKEVRVGGDRVSVTRLEASIITGLQLSITPNSDPNYGYIAKTSVSHKLTTKYQEGLLDIKVRFSDGTTTPLNEMSDSSYHLSVESLDNSVVAFAPVARLDHPRVIAIGQGKGDLLHISLELPTKCHKRRTQPLATINAYVNIDFDDESGDDDDVQNDSYYLNVKLKAARDNMANERPVNDYNGGGYIKKFDEPSVQAHQYPHGTNGHEMTPLWIGIYALLGVFGLAIVVFTISCMVYAVRYRKKNVPVVKARIPENESEQMKQQNGAAEGDSVAHAHDWVWLGRATLERNSVNTGCSQTLVPLADMNGNQPLVHGSSGSVCRRSRHPSCSSSHRPKSSCRNSNTSFPGSEANFRITPNPQDGSDVPLIVPPTSFTRVPSQKAVNVPSWVAAADAQAHKEKDKLMRIHANPIHPHQGVPLPAPVPPVRHLRNANGNVMGTYTVHDDDNPPPVPPHANIPVHKRSIDRKAHSSATYTRDVADDSKVKEGGAISSVVEGEQASPCVDDMDQDGDWDSVRMGMDYDQLMEYFDNLKESDA